MGRNIQLDVSGLLGHIRSFRETLRTRRLSGGAREKVVKSQTFDYFLRDHNISDIFYREPRHVLTIEIPDFTGREKKRKMMYAAAHSADR
jgi:hypothetical protein